MKNFQSFKTSPEFNTVRYNEGLQEELFVLPLLRAFFRDESIDLFEEGFNFDFYGAGKVIEFKSRKNSSRAYPDTAIGDKKIAAAQHVHGERGLNVYFVFKFTDGVFYWKYDPTITLRQYPINNITHYFIPRALLIPFDESGIV